MRSRISEKRNENRRKMHLAAQAWLENVFLSKKIFFPEFLRKNFEVATNSFTKQQPFRAMLGPSGM